MLSVPELSIFFTFKNLDEMKEASIQRSIGTYLEEDEPMLIFVDIIESTIA